MDRQRNPHAAPDLVGHRRGLRVPQDGDEIVVKAQVARHGQEHPFNVQKGVGPLPPQVAILSSFVNGAVHLFGGDPGREEHVEKDGHLASDGVGEDEGGWDSGHHGSGQIENAQGFGSRAVVVVVVVIGILSRIADSATIVNGANAAVLRGIDDRKVC